ncbi:MAG: hypothetical protein ACOCV1_05140 [Bacillota bacterium]
MDQKTSLKQYKILIKNGNLGFYQRTEITTIFAINKKHKKARNLYTIVVFEELDLDFNQNKYLTDERLISINDNYSLGIKREFNNLAVIEKKYKELLKENKWSDHEEQLDIAELKPVPKQFVCSNGSKLIPLNSVLKIIL